MFSYYQEHLNLKDAVFTRIDHEDAMVAIVYKVTKSNQEQFILKICDHSNNYKREVFFLKHFADILPIPKIIQVVEPTNDMHGAILMEYLPGNLLMAEELTETLGFEIGRCLALVHLNRFHGFGDPLQQDLTTDPRVYFKLKFEEGLEECKQQLPKDLIGRCRGFYEDNVNLLTEVDGPCIAHRDFRPGNIMVESGKLQGIIDWAGARSTCAEDDFCAVEHGEWPIQQTRKKALLEGYASIRPVPDYEAIMPFLRLNKAIAILGFTIKRRTWNNSNSRIYHYNRQFIEELVNSK